MIPADDGGVGDAAEGDATGEPVALTAIEVLEVPVGKFRAVEYGVEAGTSRILALGLVSATLVWFQDVELEMALAHVARR